MQNDIIENFQKLNQLALENFKKLGETNLRIGEQLLQEQIELTNAIFESTSGCASKASDIKDLKDAAAKQAEWAQECSQKIMRSCRTSADIMAEAGKVYTNLFETSLKTASNASEKAAGKSRKSA
ncbi:MAG: phasin family protein [Proteobacteria bacterium]|nr:phasin family protein [Pseudomonadota bacterium]